MTRPFRAALPSLLLLFASPASGQTSLGQPGSLPPPRPAAPTTGAPATAPAPRPPAAPQATAPRPQAQPAPARPPATPPPRPPAQPQAGTAPRSAPPTLQQRPGTSNSAQPARPAQANQGNNANRRRAAGAAAGVAAGTAAGAAGAAALGAARPPDPAPAPPPPAPKIGSATGLPLPRFAALGSNQVNLRIGPDLRYKIEWTYQRKDLPVQIVEEHQIWRRIRDPEGTEGWVQRPLLASRRTFLVQGEERVLRRRPEENADAVARLKPGVIGVLRKCEEKSPWCEARVGEYGGWIRRNEIWGVAAEEAVN